MSDVCEFVRASKTIDPDTNFNARAQLNANEKPLPNEIGGHKILGLVGEGGMGIVYAAEFRGAGMEPRPVALKVPKPSPHAEAIMRRHVPKLTS